MKKSDVAGKAQPGDSVLVETSSGNIRGRLLESYDKGIVLVKLGSGYNQGINKHDVLSMKLLDKPKESREEVLIEQDKKLPIISMIVTGGTISSRLDYATGGVKWLMSPEELFAMSPQTSRIARINRIEKPFMLASENMTSSEWIKLARKAAELLNKPENQGLIITHGTDTLHYTAAALSFMLQDLNKPVVLTYAQRSTDRGSSDTSLNLACAAHAALSNMAEVMLVGHGSIADDYCLAIRGTKVRKMHSSRRDTFRPINDMPLAKITADGKLEIINKNFRKKDEKRKVKLDASFDDKIALIKYYPGARPDLLESLRKKGYHGIIVEATGLGHVATKESKFNWLPEIKKCISNGMIVCFAPQTIYGRLDPYVYSPGRELLKAGVIFLEDMLPETAYVKLGWVLGHKEIAKKPEKIKEMMLKNIAGEINKRISPESFLY